MKKLKNTPIPLALCGLLAGFTNGLLGAGGGIIIVYALSALLEKKADSRDIFANSLCVMFPVSLVSCFIYFRGGSVGTHSMGTLLLPAIIGGAVGGFALSKINTRTLKMIFSLLVTISGIILIFR